MAEKSSSPNDRARDSGSTPGSGSEAELRRRLDVARRELLDLTARNRLLHTPRRSKRSSTIEVQGEDSDHVYQLLVADGKAMTFEASPEPPASAETASSALQNQPSGGYSDVDGQSDDAVHASPAPALEQPNEDAERPSRDERDDRLQTSLPSSLLQKRLLRAYYSARTYEEEQGVNILYLALGFLKWFEADKPAKERFAPLLLIPVELERPSAASRFRVRWTGEDLDTNLSLQVKLRAEFRIELPSIDKALSEDEEIDPDRYFDLVRAAIDGQKGWQVFDDDIVLGFFSFSKLLMYRDLDPGAWPESRSLHTHPLMGGLLGVREIAQQDASSADSTQPTLEESPLIDSAIDPRETMHVVDADSSQAIVVEEASRGRSLVIQGPPGTGKSQTIANIIATAVKQRKRVLFAAEKVAALNVVKDRLHNIGLGEMCLALHSNKARKAAVLEDIGRTLALDKPIVGDAQQVVDQLKEALDRLNAHVMALHTPLPPTGVTAWQCVGELSRLRAEGVPTSEFTLEGCQAWTSDEYRQRRNGVRELAAYVQEIGTPAKHPWRGVMLQSILPMDLDRLLIELPSVKVEVQAALDAAIHLAGVLAQPEHVARSLTLHGSRTLVAAANHMADAPDMDRNAIADDVWKRHRSEIARAVAIGAKIAETRKALASTLHDSAWTTDFAGARKEMAAHGEGLFRFLSSAYRRSKAKLRGVLATGAVLPKSLADRLTLMDSIIEVRSGQAVLLQLDAIARRAFGSFWHGEDSNWNALKDIESWETRGVNDPRVPANFRSIASSITDTRSLAQASEQCAAACERAEQRLKYVHQSLQLDVAEAFASTDDTGVADLKDALEGVPLQSLVARIDQWRASPEEVSRWIAYRTRDGHLREAGLGDLCDRLADGRVGGEQAVDRFDAAYFERILRQLTRVHPMLTGFDGLAHERLLQRFRELDLKRIGVARAEVALAHWERLPRGQNVLGEVGVIRRELAKKRRHLPIRQLLRNAGNAVQAIKPVFMMSPLSIAQYIEPGALEFDILLIDEASQVRPVDALGAIARCRQIIVVGDDKQLPPTRFFMREVEGDVFVDDEAEEELSATADLESILGLCGSLNLPQKMLRWHYRSRHHSLIAVSNREFYDNRLYVIPSPHERDSTRGLIFHHIADGVFDRGGSATNVREAAAVADAVMHHAATCPKQSLGVGAFSVQQRDAILDELELRRRKDPSHEGFFASDHAEPFFVKNLENIQGDERDVIFISVGYGRDASGSLTMNFGPLSNQGGERRLNVLITRAKSRCEVFSSLTADDIDLNRATGKGPAAFKAFLNYAQHGVLEGTDVEGSLDAMNTVLAQSLQNEGWHIDSRVGVGGFFVDLAVRSPNAPQGEYALGILSDGPEYAAARSARDRDRTQPFVLSDRGWKLHRVWSLDFFNRPEEQLERMLSALARPQTSRPAPVDVAEPRREPPKRTAKTGDGIGHSLAIPYREASFRVPASRDIPDVPIERLAEIVSKIVEIETPIHSDEIVERIRRLWNAGRLGARMLRAIDAAMEWAVRTDTAVREGDFYLHGRDEEVPVRDRSNVESVSLRDPAMLPPMEIDACIKAILQANFGAAREETITAVARTLGFRSTTAALRDTIEARLSDLLRSQSIIEDDQRLRINDRAG